MRGDEPAQAEPLKHWQRHRPDNNRTQLPKEFIANLERSEVVRVGKERAACIALSAENTQQAKMRVTSSFLFVRRSTQSYDELLAAVPIRPRPCIMLGMINTSDILSIGENAHACNSSVAGDPSAIAADNSSLPSRFSAGLLK